MTEVCTAFKSKINNSFMKKYALQKTYQTLSTDQIKIIAKQILVALQFIYSKGLFYGESLARPF